jgi:hypothetical protein
MHAVKSVPFWHIIVSHACHESNVGALALPSLLTKTAASAVENWLGSTLTDSPSAWAGNASEKRSLPRSRSPPMRQRSDQVAEARALGAVFCTSGSKRFDRRQAGDLACHDNPALLRHVEDVATHQGKRR